MANRWRNSGNSGRLYFWGSKITADDDCSHEIKRHLLFGIKVMTNLDSVLKSKDITLLTKVRLVKDMVFPVVMDGCESWTIRKAEGQRINAFGLWCWRRLLRVTWTARKCIQSILKEICPEYQLEGLMLTDAEAETLILWPLDEKKWLIWKAPDAGKDWRREKKGRTKDEMVECITNSMCMSFSKFWELVMDREAWCTAVRGSQRVRHNWTEQLNWTELS